MMFEMYQKVLCRNSKSELWVPALYSRTLEHKEPMKYETIGGLLYKYCIPYMGSETLAFSDTNIDDLPKGDYRPSRHELVLVSNHPTNPVETGGVARFYDYTKAAGYLVYPATGLKSCIGNIRDYKYCFKLSDFYHTM